MPKPAAQFLRHAGLGCVLVIVATAAATAVAGLLQFKQLARDISGQAALKVAVTLPDPGAPQTLLLIGSDHRASDPSYRDARTDTMLLMRIDPKSSTINVLSIPRDLEVRIPTGSTASPGRLNSAYSVGGPNLLLKILKTQVFPGFHVNHVIDVNFRGFSDLIDAIGCVDTDVDHRYYNVSAPGPDNYSSIDIQPGYQKLCGDQQSAKGALAFVRFRHTDSDIVRSARQQDFIRWARENYSGSEVFTNRDRLLRIFGQHAQTDPTLHSADALENLIVLIAFSAGHQLKQIPFPAQFSACNPTTTINGTVAQAPCYVTAERSLERKVYRALMTPTTGSATPKAATAAPTPKRRKPKSSRFDAAGAVSDIPDGQAQASALRRAGLPVYYPALIAPGARYCTSITGDCSDVQEPASAYAGSYPRQYVIHDGNHVYKSYRMTVEVNSSLGEYYGIQGTTWKAAPILTRPTQTQVVNGKRLLEYFNGSRLSLVAWRLPDAAYWISNTLTDSIPNKQLIAIAASLRISR